MHKILKYKSDYISLAVLLSACLYFYFPLLEGKVSFIFRDMFTILLPFEHIVKNLLRAGELPLWNPYAVTGKPLVAEPLAGIFYLPNLLFLAFPQPLSQNLSIIFHHFFAAIGCYAVCKSMGLNSQSSVCAAIFYSFGGVFVSLDNMINGLQSTTWLPWALWALTLYINFNLKKYSLLSIIFTALIFTGGMPEVILMEAALIFLYCLYKGENRFKNVRNACLIILFGLLLCSILLFPFIEYILFSSRSSGLNPDHSLRFSVDPRNLTGFIFGRRLLSADGSFHASQSLTSGFYNEIPWLLSYYLGLAIPLTLLAALKVRGSKTLWAIGTVTIFTFLSFGSFVPGIYALFQKWPILASLRYPEKWLIPVHLILSVAAAYGTSYLTKNSLKNILPVAIALISFFDLSRINSNLMPLLEWQPLVAETKISRLIKDDNNFHRIYSNNFGIPQNGNIKTETEISRNLMLDQVSAFYGIGNINSPASINLRDHEKLMQIVEESKDKAPKILAALGVEYIVSLNPLTGYQGISETEIKDPFVYSVSNPAPIVSLAKKVHAVSSQKKAFDFLAQAEDSSSEVAVEDFGLNVTSGDGDIKIIKYGANEIEIEADIKNGSVLVIRDSFYPGWHAYINDRPTKIFRVNGALRGISVPHGRHQIKLNYLPFSLIWGASITIITLAVIQVYFFGFLQLRRKTNL